MANDVFANGREVSCKKADGKSICAFPDVCFTPPENPATPPGVPVPYPNTGMAKDTTSGSKTVKISGNEVMLKNKSYFKKSIGDEAGCAAKKGAITSVNRGKVYFTSWSMDVMIEGENVVRHLDMTTHNHASPLANTPPWLYLDSSSASNQVDHCAGVRTAIDRDCSESEFNQSNQPPDGNCSEDCCEAKQCVLAKKNSNPQCCDGKTKHHVIPDHCFKEKGDDGLYYDGFTSLFQYSTKEGNYNQGLCICADGKDKNERNKDHATIHDWFDLIEYHHTPSWSFAEASYWASKTCSAVTGCREECLKQQTGNFYREAFGTDQNTLNNATLRADAHGDFDNPDWGTMGIQG